MKRLLVAACVVIAVTVPHVSHAAPSCSGGDSYTQALCNFARHDYDAASRGFRSIVERAETTPETLKSMYFLARTDMKMRRWTEASEVLTRIYSIAPGFYHEWNCDFLLGECRRALGKD